MRIAVVPSSELEKVWSKNDLVRRRRPRLLTGWGKGYIKEESMAKEKTDYEWVTSELFDRKLAEIVGEMTGWEVIQIPEVYVAVSEHLNNQVLEELEQEREQEKLLDENTTADRGQQ